MKEKESKISYFPHDTNASNDPKLVSLRINFGWKGIGMYWAIIEALHKEINGELPSNLVSDMIYDFYCQEEIREMAHVKEESKEFEQFLYTNVLLMSHERITTSKRVKENIEQIKLKSDKARESVMKRWEKASNIKEKNKDTNVIRGLYERNTIKEKKIKENKIKNIYIAADAAVVETLPETNKTITEIINVFRQITPTLSFNNKSERTYTKKLIDVIGKEQALNAAKYALSVQSEQFAPKITTPYQLFKKIGELKAYKSKPKGGLAIIQ
jgi:hypothetical protein